MTERERSVELKAPKRLIVRFHRLSALLSAELECGHEVFPSAR